MYVHRFGVVYLAGGGDGGGAGSAPLALRLEKVSG